MDADKRAGVCHGCIGVYLSRTDVNMFCDTSTSFVRSAGIFISVF